MVDSSASQASSSLRSQSPVRPGLTSRNSVSSQSQSGSLFSTLNDISPLIEFLTDDERPTLILEVLSSNVAVPHLPRVVFQNFAFTSFLNRTVTRDSYDDWLRTLSAGVAFPTSRPLKQFGGRAWTSKRFRNAWRVIYCSQPEDDKRLDIVTEAPTCPPSPDRDTFVPGPSLQQVHGPPSHLSAWGDYDEDGYRRCIDWTRFPLKVHQSPWIDFLKTYDWDRTALGPMSQWPDDLRRLAVLIMSSPEYVKSMHKHEEPTRHAVDRMCRLRQYLCRGDSVQRRIQPRMVYWGEEQVNLYNEAAATLIGQKHPRFALGNRFVDVWGPDIHEKHRKMIKFAVTHGKVAEAKDFEAILERNGFIEETYWNIHLQPCSGPDGTVVAALNEYREVTSVVYHEQRRTIIDKIQRLVTMVDTLPQLWSQVSEDLQNNLSDASFGLIYVATNQQNNGFTNAINKVNSFCLDRSIGITPQGFEPIVNVGENLHRPSLGMAFAEARRSQQVVALRQQDGRLPSELSVLLPDRGFVTTACVLPITSVSGQQLAFIVLGMNPRRYFDDECRLFVSHVGDLITKAAALISLPEEQRRDQEKFEEINVALSQQLRIAALRAEKNEETFTRMARNAPFGMYMFNPDGTPKYVNDAYLKLMGLTREEFERAAAIGYAWNDSLFEEDVESINNIWKQLITTKIATTFEYRVKVPSRKPGDPPGTRNLECIAFPELDEEGHVITMQGWLVDISHRKLTESLMAQRLEDALETKRASENFIDMTSHEMRNPLSAILQCADGILTSLSSPPQTRESVSGETIETIVDAAQTITLCAQHQKCIVDDILTLSKLDSSLLVITPDKIQAPDLIRKALKMYDAELNRTNIQASLIVQPNYDNAHLDYVMLDPSRLLQVIINLLTNAIKFTQFSETRHIRVLLSASENPPSGEDHRVAYIGPRKRQSTTPLSTSPEWGAGEEIYLQFAVQDTGKGLTEDEMKLLFKRFSQSSPKTYKQYGGSGLGLFISRELVELQGGQIGVYSEEGAGSTFSFYVKARRCTEPAESRKRQASVSLPSVTSPVILPRAASEEKRAAVTQGTIQASSSLGTNISPKDLHVLIVEDNAINQRVMTQQLRKLGCTVYTADHGLDALKFLKTTTWYTSPEQVPLSIILMDLEMPIMDGLTCVRRIRESEQTGEILGHVPVIAITANARFEQIKTALDAGMDEVRTKPFRIPELVPQMQALVQKNSQQMDLDLPHI